MRRTSPQGRPETDRLRAVAAHRNQAGPPRNSDAFANLAPASCAQLASDTDYVFVAITSQEHHPFCHATSAGQRLYLVSRVLRSRRASPAPIRLDALTLAARIALTEENADQFRCLTTQSQEAHPLALTPTRRGIDAHLPAGSLLASLVASRRVCTRRIRKSHGSRRAGARIGRPVGWTERRRRIRRRDVS